MVSWLLSQTFKMFSTFSNQLHCCQETFLKSGYFVVSNSSHFHIYSKISSSGLEKRRKVEIGLLLPVILGIIKRSLCGFLYANPYGFQEKYLWTRIPHCKDDLNCHLTFTDGAFVIYLSDSEIPCSQCFFSVHLELFWWFRVFVFKTIIMQELANQPCTSGEKWNARTVKIPVILAMRRNTVNHILWPWLLFLSVWFFFPEAFPNSYLAGLILHVDRDHIYLFTSCYLAFSTDPGTPEWSLWRL